MAVKQGEGMGLEAAGNIVGVSSVAIYKMIQRGEPVAVAAVLRREGVRYVFDRSALEQMRSTAIAKRARVKPTPPPRSKPLRREIVNAINRADGTPLTLGQMYLSFELAHERSELSSALALMEADGVLLRVKIPRAASSGRSMVSGYIKGPKFERMSRKYAARRGLWNNLAHSISATLG